MFTTDKANIFEYFAKYINCGKLRFSTAAEGLDGLNMKAKGATDFIGFVLFIVLLTNFFSPTLSFVTSFFNITPLFSLVLLLDWFRLAVPFVILMLFYGALKVSPFPSEKHTSNLLTLQAVLALPIFAIWFDQNFTHTSGYLAAPFNFVVEIANLVFIDVLYLAFFVALWKTVKKENRTLGLEAPFEPFYLWVNLAFLLSVTLHIVNRIDFLYYLGFHKPPELNDLFGYAPTMLVSVTCLLGWKLYFKSAKRKLVAQLAHVALVTVPILLVVFAEVSGSRLGYVITSIIGWGSSYEFFHPPVVSLALVLSAVGAFFSFSIMLKTGARARNRNQIWLGLASAALAGVSFSLVSILGVLASLYVLLHGIILQKETD